MAEWKTVSRTPVDSKTSMRIVRNRRKKKNYIVTYSETIYQAEQQKMSRITEKTMVREIANQEEVEKYIFDKLQKNPLIKQEYKKNEVYLRDEKGQWAGHKKIEYRMVEKTKYRMLKKTRTKIEKEAVEIDRHEQQVRAIIDTDIVVYQRARWGDGTIAEIDAPARVIYIEGFETEARKAAVKAVQRQVLQSGQGFERIYDFTDMDTNEMTVIKARI